MYYKKHTISETKNEYGYFEAVPDDCDAAMFYDKSIEGLKETIDLKSDL